MTCQLSWVILMPKAYLQKINDIISPITWIIGSFDTFPKCISLQVNVIAQLELKVAYLTATVQNFNHYFGWLVGFHVISTFVGYLTPNTFLCK